MKRMGQTVYDPNDHAPCVNTDCEDNEYGKRCCIPNWYGCKERKADAREGGEE